MNETTTTSEFFSPNNENCYKRFGYYQEFYSATEKPKVSLVGAQTMYLETIIDINGKPANRHLVFNPERWHGLPIKIGTAGNNGNGGESANLSESTRMVSDMLRAKRCLVFAVKDSSRLFALAPKPQDQTPSSQ